MSLPRLGVNIDHIATLRQLRGTPYPDLLEAAKIVESAGGQQITVHLREDRRHIQDDDVKKLRDHLRVPLNLEMAVSPAIIQFACQVKPDWACLVPEKRQEVTTEGGLNIKKAKRKVGDAITRLKKAGIRVSLFIEPSLESVRLGHALGADAVELHTGRYCIATQQSGAKFQAKAKTELARIEKASRAALDLGLHAHAGHGLDYENVRPMAALELIEEYNIGHSIVCRASLVGMERAVREMISAILAP